VHRWLLLVTISMVAPASAWAQQAPQQPEEEPPVVQPDPTPAPDRDSPADPPADAEDPGEAEPDPEAGAAGGLGAATPATAQTPPVAPGEGAADAAVAANKSRSNGGQGFLDTRLNVTFTNENVLADPDETHVPNVPGFRFGPPSSLGTLFFDNYDTRFSGFETLSHAVLYKSYEHEAWDVEGALVLRVNDLSERSIALSDAGSYVRVAHWFDPGRQRTDRVSVTAFPTSSDRFRLGYSYRLSWGGSNEYRRDSEPVPGVKVQYENDKVYAFVGAKTSVLVDASIDEERSVFAYLAGAGLDITEMLRVEVNGGFFDRGSNELEDVRDEKVQLFGASAQVALHQDMPVLSSVDYKLYRNDPERVVDMFRKEQYPGGLSWLVAVEGTLIGQTLKDLESPGSTKVQQGMAGDVNVRVKHDHTRYRADFQYRDLAFILHPTPSLPSYTDFPDEYDITANLFAALGVDQHFPGPQLTLGAVVGVELPASLTTPKGIPGDLTGEVGESTAVVRGEEDITILPAGEEVVAQVATKLTARLDFADHFASILDVYYAYDPNRTRLRRDGPEDLLEYEFDEDNFNQLGLNFNLQARF
jgi:hypothetical protein